MATKTMQDRVIDLANKAVESEIEARTKLAASVTGDMAILASELDPALKAIEEGKPWRRLLMAAGTSKDPLKVLLRMRESYMDDLLSYGPSYYSSPVANALSHLEQEAIRTFMRRTAIFVPDES